MADATYAQANFLGGEFSPAFQGRFDFEDYKRGLALCLNYIPSQEGSLRTRSGFRRCGFTKNTNAAKIIPFRFTANAPYIAEFTDNFLRLWSSGLPVLDSIIGTLTAYSAGTFTMHAAAPVSATQIPPSWPNGCSILILPGNSVDMAANPSLFNREFILTIVSASAGTFTLTDMYTGDPLTGTFSFGSSQPHIVRILDISTPYSRPEGVRILEHTDQTATTDPSTQELLFSPPEHRATFLYPYVSPMSLSYEQSFEPYPPNPSQHTVNGYQGLIAENFIDGPYLDSQGTTQQMSVSGTTGTVTVAMHQWDTTTVYNAGALVLDYTQDPTVDPYYYMSLTDNNVGNALPTAAFSGSVNAHWLQVTFQLTNWDSSATYNIGQATTAAPYDGFHAPPTELPVYYSKVDSNTNNPPATSPTDWATTPPNYSGAVNYHKAAIVLYTDGNLYVSTNTTTAGTAPGTTPWVPLPITIEQACTTITDLNVGWIGQGIFRVDDAGGPFSTLGETYGTNNPGRVFRMKWGPQPWSNKTTYAINAQVNYNDVLYTSLTNANTNNIPDTDAVNWQIDTQTIFWTWGRIVDASVHQFVAQIQILGPDLPTDAPIWEWQFGLYSDTTGWPTCGAYHEGRLFIAGSTPNRFDAGCPDQGFNFAPTAPDGTVSDGNAIAYILNSKKDEHIQAFGPITEGVEMFTDEAEWLISASAMNDPITPTSVQAHRTTAWSAHPDEVTQLPTALAAIQKGGRRVMEYRLFIDMTSYQSRMNALDLTRKCQHLTQGGVGQTQYQTLTQPILWVSPQSRLTVTWAPLNKAVCPVSIYPPTTATILDNANLFGIGYLRSPDLSYEAPFSFEHGQTLAGSPYSVSSIAVQKAWQDGQENLYAVVEDPQTYFYVEMMDPLFESTPLNTVFNSNGTVAEWGTLDKAFMVDSGVQPVGAIVASNGLSVTFYGVYPHAGKLVSFTCRGKYVGDFTIAADGSINVPFNSAFSIVDLGAAMNPLPGFVTAPLNPSGTGYHSTVGGTNELVTPATVAGLGINGFTVNANGNTMIIGPLTGQTGEGASAGFFGQFGFKFRRRGKMLRPQVGGLNGPTFAKIVRADKAAIYVDACQEVYAGTDFSKLDPVQLTKNGPKDVTPLGPGDFTTGIFRIEIEDDLSFDGQICWEQTSPAPGNILAVGGFDLVTDL